MLFKPKDDQEAINRAEKMYGAGINRGLAGFVAQKDKQKKQGVPIAQEEVVLTTTEHIPENDYRIIGTIVATGTDHEKALLALQKKAKGSNADVVVAVRFDSNSTNVTAYGTAAKLVR